MCLHVCVCAADVRAHTCALILFSFRVCVSACPPGVGADVVEKSYLGAVSSMTLNGDYAAAVFEGKVLLHLVSLDLSSL